MKKVLLGLSLGMVVLLAACSGSFNPARIESDEPMLEIATPDIEVDVDVDIDDLDDMGFGMEMTGPGANARATYMVNRLYIDGEEVDEVWMTEFGGSSLMFIGEEAGGNVLIFVGEAEAITATINPSREHPSFESGEWHHHLYAGVAGGERINFMALLPGLNIDDNAEATDNTQSIYQRGNLHYIVETGEFRLRLTIDGALHELFFVQL